MNKKNKTTNKKNETIIAKIKELETLVKNSKPELFRAELKGEFGIGLRFSYDEKMFFQSCGSVNNGKGGWDPFENCSDIAEAMKAAKKALLPPEIDLDELQNAMHIMSPLIYGVGMLCSQYMDESQYVGLQWQFDKIEELLKPILH